MKNHTLHEQFVLSAFQDYIVSLSLRSKIKRKVVVLLRLDAIGDFVIWLDSAKEFKRRFPLYRIVVICRKEVVEIAKSQSCFDEVFGIELGLIEKSAKYYLKILICLLRYLGCDLFQTVYSRTPIMDVIASSIIAHSRVAISHHPECDNSVKNNEALLYDVVGIVSRDWKHESIKNAEFIRSIGVDGFMSSIYMLPYNHKKVSHEYYVVAPGTNEYKRTWAPEKWVELISILCERYSLKCYLLGAKSDREIGEYITRRVDKNELLINVIGNTSIIDYIDYIGNAKFVLSADTSAAHIAAATRTKAVAIIGGWHYERFLPYMTEDLSVSDYYPITCCRKIDCYYCNRKRVTQECKRHEKRYNRWKCMDIVSVNDVVKRIDSIFC